MADVLDTFRRSCLHGEEWPRQVCALFVPSRRQSTDPPPVFRNQPSSQQHAEEALLESLKRHLKRSRAGPGTTSVTIYQNYSPCSDCSQRFVDFLQDMGYWLQLTIVFVAFYKIGRPSCSDRGCTHHVPSGQEARKNLQGLKSLQQQGALLRSFQPEDWTKLGQLLDVTVYHDDRREEEDEVMAEDVQDMLRGSEEEEDEDEDEEEDEMTAQDVQQMLLGNQRWRPLQSTSGDHNRMEAPSPKGPNKDVVINMNDTEKKKPESWCEKLCTIL